MQANRGRDTKPELAVRRLLHAAGLRYRVDVAPVRGLHRRADVLFPRQRIAVFIDGCFWHGCPEHGPTKFTANRQFWTEKIETNRVRDADTNKQLDAAGWTVLRYWEHTDPVKVATVIADAVRAATIAGSRPYRGQNDSADHN